MPRKIVVSSLFNASIDVIWEELLKLSTLQHIASPFATFSPLKSSDIIWQKGQTATFSLKLFGFLNFGIHTIKIIECDKSKQTIYTNESNKSVPTWNHRIMLKTNDDGIVKYTDEVEIDAGWKTIFVYLWSVMFYRHRQKKWRKLIKTIQSQSVVNTEKISG